MSFAFLTQGNVCEANVVEKQLFQLLSVHHGGRLSFSYILFIFNVNIFCLSYDGLKKKMVVAAFLLN